MEVYGLKSFFLSKTFIITYLIVLVAFASQIMSPAINVNYIALIFGSFVIAAVITFIIKAFIKLIDVITKKTS